ncbi:MAG: hypothetical protein RIQ81_1594 [Pseudomonadota bacterium]
MALAIFSAVTVVVSSIMETTFKAQKQAELKYDLQMFMLRLNQDVDCAKTLAAYYNPSANVWPTNVTCGALTLKDSDGENILVPTGSGVFTGAGPISRSWWGKATCDESQRSILVSVALRKRGSWTEFGKNPLRDPKDASDTQHYMTWTNKINPVIGGTGQVKLCEKYFNNTASQNTTCSPGQYATGYSSKDLRCAYLPDPLNNDCGTGKVMVNFSQKSNTPVCRQLTTGDLDANPSLAEWIRGQLIPTCYTGQIYVANAMAGGNTMMCAGTARSVICGNGTDTFPASATTSCSLLGYTGSPSVNFDFRNLPAFAASAATPTPTPSPTPTPTPTPTPEQYSTEAACCAASSAGCTVCYPSSPGPPVYYLPGTGASCAAGYNDGPVAVCMPEEI